MPRRGQEARNAVRKAQRDTAAALSSQHGSYDPPDRGEPPTKRWEMPYDDANTVRLEFLLWRDGGRIINFVVNVRVLTSEGWSTVEYFDCCHGHCHLHPRNEDAPTATILRLDGVDDVQRAFERVQREAHDRARIIRGKE